MIDADCFHGSSTSVARRIQLPAPCARQDANEMSNWRETLAKSGHNTMNSGHKNMEERDYENRRFVQ